MIDPDIFSAEDLVSNPEKFSSIEPAIRLGVIGDPVAHSRSPVFQNAALAACGIPARYTRLHVPPERFVDAVRALPRAAFLGANVTIPHKAAALAVVDEADDYARASGSVNTIVVSGGKLHGFNTDGPGLVRAIREEFSVGSGLYRWNDSKTATAVSCKTSSRSWKSRVNDKTNADTAGCAKAQSRAACRVCSSMVVFPLPVT